MKSFLYYSGALHVFMMVGLVVMGTLLSKPRMSYYSVDLLSSLPAGGGVTPGPVVSPQKSPAIKTTVPKVAPRSKVSSDEDLPDQDTIRMLAKLKKKRLSQPKSEAREAPRESQETAMPASSAGHGGSGLAGSGSGIVADAGGIPFPYPWYLKAIADKLDKQWKPPQEFEANTLCEVSFVISRTGEISGSRLSKSSGDSLFDQLALRAVLYSNPMPALPPGFPDDALKVHMKFVGKKY